MYEPFTDGTGHQPDNQIGKRSPCKDVIDIPLEGEDKLLKVLGWYVVWLIGLWLLVQLFGDAGMTYDSSDAAFTIKFIVAAAWTAALIGFVKFMGKSA